MAYEKLNLVNGTVLTADHVAHMEDGIFNSAPGGYGYGGSALDLGQLTADDEVDTAISNAYDKLVGTETALVTWIDSTGWRWFASIEKSSANNGMVIAWTVYKGGLNKVKAKLNGVWQPWEWGNPPMVIGVEYRTTKRFNDKAVYAKAFNFGALPNGTTKQMAHNLSKTAVVDYRGTSHDGKYYFPSGTSSAGTISLYINAVYIIMECSNDWSSVSAYISVEYTKD